MFNFSYFQAQKTSNLLHKIANLDTDGVYTQRIMIFSQQLLHRIPIFHCGLFTYDLNLAFKVKAILMTFNFVVYKFFDINIFR